MPGLALTVATPWIVVTLPTAIQTFVFIAVRLAISTDKPDESAIHSMKEKQP